MRLKTLPPLICLALILAQASFAQTPPRSPEEPNSAYGIESDKFYPGSLVLELLTAAEAEIDAAVREAYAEGYKAAALWYAPELAARDQRLAALNLTVETFKQNKRNHIRNLFIAGGVSFLGGISCGLLIGR
jgi:hypothetical protein